MRNYRVTSNVSTPKRTDIGLNCTLSEAFVLARLLIVNGASRVVIEDTDHPNHAPMPKAGGRRED